MDWSRLAVPRPILSKFVAVYGYVKFIGAGFPSVLSNEDYNHSFVLCGSPNRHISSLQWGSVVALTVGLLLCKYLSKMVETTKVIACWA